LQGVRAIVAAERALWRVTGVAMALGLIVFDTYLDLSEAPDGDRRTRASPMLRISDLENVDPRRMVVIGARGPRNLPEWTPLYRNLAMTVFPMEAVESGDRADHRTGVRNYDRG
jgi:Arginase family